MNETSINLKEKRYGESGHVIDSISNTMTCEEGGLNLARVWNACNESGQYAYVLSKATLLLWYVQGCEHTSVYLNMKNVMQ